jgi:hypothetical protein
MLWNAIMILARYMWEKLEIRIQETGDRIQELQEFRSYRMDGTEFRARIRFKGSEPIPAIPGGPFRANPDWGELPG